MYFRVIGVAFISMVFVFGCGGNASSIELPDEIDVKVERAEDIEIFYSDSAKIKVKILAPVMLYHFDLAEPKQEFPDGVLVEFFDESGEKSSELTANWGIRMERQQEVIVQDSVVWKSVHNEMLETEELIWKQNERKVFTKKFAKITRPDEIIYGYGFETDQQFNNARINAVTGRILVDEPNQ